MRITNKVMQNNSLNNINTNKLLQDRLSTQMSTQKKVDRPSDDPVVAIRALRLRTNVNQIKQYYEKNVPDAESWLSLTEDAIKSMTEVVTDMYENATKGSNENLSLEDKKIILTQLKSLRSEVYSTGNTDYAGRYIFTGYRTDSSLTFMKDTTKQYSITEQVDKSKIDSITHVSTGDLMDITEANFAGVTVSAEDDISIQELHRLRISYQNVDDNANAPTIVYKKADGAGGYTDEIINCDVVSLYDANNPYELDYSGADADKAILIKETGEIILGDNVYQALMDTKDDPATPADEGEIRITYEKSDWKNGDLRPEHYFACTNIVDPLDPTKNIVYNESYLNGIQEKQSIEYDVGLNQTIRVNTTADEIFTHDIGRDVDDMIASLEESLNLEELVSKLKGLLEVEGNINDPAKKATLEEQLEAAEKALTFSNEKTQKLFEGCITKMQGHLDTVNLASTQNGTRSQRLELIGNRLMSQKTNYETLQSENEDADITEVAIKLSSAELTYNASLMATGKILQNSLMNFI
ncbi:MAG: flagellin [Lachnospiraceae bacterium]